MTVKGYLLLSGIFFLFIAGMHLLRLIFQVPVQIDTWSAPVWISFGGTVIPGILSYFAFRLKTKTILK